MQRLGHLERLDRPRRHGRPRRRAPAARGRAASAPSRRRRAARPRRAARIRLAHSSGRPGTSPASSSSIAVGRERLEVERGEVALAGAPGRPALGQLGPGEREDEQGVAARPVEQVLDEVEQRRVRPLHVLEHEHVGISSASRSKKSRQARRVLPIALACSSSPSRWARRGSTQRRSSGSAMISSTRRAASRAATRCPRPRRSGPRAHHLGQRPVGDALAVGQAAPAVPAHALGQAVDVLEELPRRAATCRCPPRRCTETRWALASLRRGVEELLDHAQLAVATDERRLQAVGRCAPPTPRSRGAARHSAHGLGLPLSSCSPASS